MGDRRIRTRPNRLLRQVTAVLGFALVGYCLIFVFKSPSIPAAGRQTASFSPETGFHKKQSLITPETLNNLSLDEEQCKASFPGLNKEIDDVVAEGPFKVKQNIASGPLQGRIKNGQVRVAIRPLNEMHEVGVKRVDTAHGVDIHNPC